MVLRIDPVLAAGEDRDGAGGQRRLVGTGIDAAASPDTTTRPASPRPRASRSVKARPAVEALREPTIATEALGSAAGSPRTAISGGAVSVACSAFG